MDSLSFQIWFWRTSTYSFSFRNLKWTRCWAVTQGSSPTVKAPWVWTCNLSGTPVGGSSFTPRLHVTCLALWTRKWIRSSKVLGAVHTCSRIQPVGTSCTRTPFWALGTPVLIRFNPHSGLVKYALLCTFSQPRKERFPGIKQLASGHVTKLLLGIWTHVQGPRHLLPCLAVAWTSPPLSVMRAGYVPDTCQLLPWISRSSLRGEGELF